MTTLSPSFDGLTIIVSEKPAGSRALTPALLAAGFDPASAVFVHALQEPLQHRLRRGLPAAQYPLFEDAIWRIRDDFSFVARTLGGDAIDDRALVEILDAVAPRVRFLCACDIDELGAWLYYTMKEVVRHHVEGLQSVGAGCYPGRSTFGDELDVDPDVKMLSYDPREISGCVDLLLAGQTTANRREKFDRKLVQRLFEANWWANAHVILRPAMNRFGLDGDGACFSKFSLPVLYRIEAEFGDDRFSEEGLIRRMDRWDGTGRFARGEIGSVRSRVSIIDLLLRAGAVSREGGPGSMRLTGAGRAFCAALPKDSNDQDLPMRLEAWKDLGESALPKMAAYQRAWFGRIGRFLKS